MRQRLFRKYFFATVFITLFSLGIMMLILTFAFSNYIAQSNYSTLQKSCKQVSNFTSNYSNVLESSNAGKNFHFIIKNIAELSDIDVYITDTTGTIKICSCNKWIADEQCDHSGSIVPTDIIEKTRGSDIKEVDTLGIYKTPHYISASVLKNSDGNTIGYVLSAAPMSAAKELMTTIMKLYLFSAIIPIVFMFFAFYGMTYKLTKPLRLMSEAAKAMAKGDFSKRIPVTSDNEIGDLAVSFNQMTNSLAQLEGMRKSFIANVSHELKTPMTTIGGFIDGIIDGTIEPEKQKYYLEIVSNEVRRLSRMVQSMLSVSKIELGEFALKPEKFNFRDMLLNIVIGQEQRIEKQNLNINGLDEITDVTINADRDLIYQVIYNLVDNAIKFTEENGSIGFGLKIDSKKITFSISNTGRGIPAAELPYVFERFYKVDKSRSANKNSTGLGLYIVKTIVKTHGGTIKVSSKENELTIFEVILPINR